MFLKECHRVLRQGGIIRIIVPNLSYFIEQYQSGQIISDEFIEKLGVLYGQKRSL
jgi:predicted SAM-dependent methyltransferase